VLEDLGSTNGTLLNGQRVSGVSSLRPGDRIEIGDVMLKVDRR
jgi:pSer/pThr/pTyr-binding forkhead associated (FHA) protein